MLIERDEVIIAVPLHELDFVSVLRAARLLGNTRENIIKQAVVNYLVQLQRQGLDVGVQLPPEPKAERKQEEKVEPTSSETSRAGDGSRHSD
jgi:hypothetical protein